MQHYLRNKIILIKYPFTDLTSAKVRPAVIIGKGIYNDVFIVPLTSKTDDLGAGEFILTDWEKAGLNVQTTVKRGIFTIDAKLILKEIGYFSSEDSEKLKLSIISWLNLF